MLDRVPEITAHRELSAAAAARGRRRRVLTIATVTAIAAMLVVGIFITSGSRRHGDASAPAAVVPTLVAAGPRAVTLADGTLVRLNAGGEVVEDFDATERRVRLTRGEAHFTVTKNPERPFVVIAGPLRVRAVGTAFNVNLQSARIEVLVTHGSVRVATAEAAVPAEPVLGVGERAVLSLASSVQPGAPAPALVVTRVDPAEMTRALAWHESLRLGGATLGELAADFERRFGQRVVIADPEIADLRAGGRVRADDTDHFVNLLATTFDLEVERSADGAWVLRKKKSQMR
jgi:transmembrane sensor